MRASGSSELRADCTTSPIRLPRSSLQLARRKAEQVAALKQRLATDDARGRPQKPKDRADGERLPCPTLANDAEDTAAAQIEGDAVQRMSSSHLIVSITGHELRPEIAHRERHQPPA